MDAHAQQNTPIQPPAARRYLAVMLIVVFPLDDTGGPVSGTAAKDGLSDPAPGSPLGHERSA